ncbi:MAG: HAMP domain-containing histidine kinase [Bacteroidales bacterium]|nr:HAMP domain-containing histidine kinase [Bacteroidales bacterium]MBN2755947.1 HAMP domain-containing histidine kinase [Bacteroidales bacterium]
MYSIIPIVFWSLKQLEYIIFLFFINLFAFYYVEFYSTADNVFFKFPENTLLFFNTFSIILSFVTIVLVILLFQSQVEKNEKLLQNKSNALKEINSDLMSKNEEILLQNEEILEQKDKLEKINHTKEKFFSIIAHDLKSPFNAILGFTELLLTDKIIENSEKNKLINIINFTAEQTLQLLENLLLWSKLESGEIHFEAKIVNINDLILNDYSLFKNIAENKELNIKFDMEDNLQAKLDKNMFSTIIRNLISNAIKFTNKNGKIIIKSLRNSDNKIIVSVADNGVGMDQDKITQLIDNDYISSTLGTEKEKGTGLGLKICKEFAAKNNAELSIESVLNKGSVFSLIINPG